jgi:predicted enzyme related to lactoylglutathione lyase
VPERDGYIPGVPCWVDTSQPDPEAALDFYSGLFGWKFENAMPPGSDGKYFIARLRGGDVAAVSSTPEGAPPTAAWNTYIWVESADDAAAKVRAAGGTILMEPFDVMTAGRMALAGDPEGAAFMLWQPRDHKGARVINEHGSLNFNGLNTRDVAGAKAFYGSVFGWRTLTLDNGAEMWTLPGYGDHLEQLNPGTRERMGALGAPPGFEDVVASITPIADGQGDVPPHWNVTFATDDAEATAEKATQLGGTVVVAPFDAPWVKMTVIADPQGGTFIASQFVMENKDVAPPLGTAATAA